MPWSFSAPRTTFSRTVRLSASMKCWCTMPMPRAMASAALARQLHATRVELTHCYGSARGCGNAPSPSRGSAGTVRSRGGLDLDGAVDDLLLRGVQLGLDVVDEATAGGQADTVLGERVGLVARQRLAVVHGLDEGVDTDVHV